MLAEEWGNMDLVFSYTFVKPLHILLHKGSPLFFTLGTMVFGFHASPFMGKQFFFCLKSDWIIIIQMWLFLVRSPFHCRNIVTLNSRNMKSFETVIPVYWMFLWVFFFFLFCDTFWYYFYLQVSKIFDNFVATVLLQVDVQTLK